jgi:predicted RNA-binding Zn-ribbon protein involved in translation (DUF1610 family)
MNEPHFYCENCGNSVALKADSCPTCGRRFDAVKCPECGFSGKSALFSDGCPSCGYLSSLTSISSDSATGSVQIDPSADIVERDTGKNRKALPGWAYTIIAIGLIGFLVFLLVTYLRLE